MLAHIPPAEVGHGAWGLEDGIGGFHAKTWNCRQNQGVACIILCIMV